MTAIALITEAAAAGVRLAARVWVDPADALPPDLRARLRAAEREVLRHLLGVADQQAIQPPEDDEFLPDQRAAAYGTCLPPAGSAERAKADAEHAEMVAGLLKASRPTWPDRFELLGRLTVALAAPRRWQRVTGPAGGDYFRCRAREQLDGLSDSAARVRHVEAAEARAAIQRWPPE